ncbi:alpha/beta hydrolase family protein [Jannaschia pohangensis]|uniref:Predicted alpha/beta hydrolase n=1 Tax=Jannaschia pohangensis TaxID=390807 RepID=A0A1I3MDJ1_9RHOB|nr:alpha/beta fold hydrolase [Jannaschia pohangensis]SFI94785.1 Predicted alpha/beta hydrolase [Jannaschia pohangensis]
MFEPVRISAGDATLAGRLFRTDGPPRAVAVLHGATGVPARFYDAFAGWLASERGVTCLTYDYRDFGESGAARGSRATMTDWGVRDQQATRDWLAGRYPRTPLWVVGHSLGGMMLPFQAGLARIDRVIAVASGAVHVTDHPWPYQAFARLFWLRGLGTLSRMMGRLPLRSIGIGHDLPAGVYVQWRRWCTELGFHAADRDLPAPDPADLTCDLRMVAVADDALCPPASVWRLMRAYPRARREQRVLRPADYGLARLGHLDVLGERGRPCWPDVIGDA